MDSSGYSGTPLFKKLGLKETYKCLLFNPLPEYSKWIESLDLSLDVHHEFEPGSYDFIHGFCSYYKDLDQLIKIYKAHLKMDGMMWVSWPKGTSKIQSELNRDKIREFVLVHGLVDVKVASINSDWSGLKFVYRLKDRK